MICYRDCKIYYNPKPIPTKKFDWDWVYKGYGGPPDNRFGWGETVEDCMQEIDEMHADLAEHAAAGI